MISRSHRQIRRWIPTPQQTEFLKSIEATRAFLHHLPDSIRKQFAGQWIAAKDGQVVAAAPTRAELAAALGNVNDPSVLKLRLEKGATIRWRRPL